MKKLITGLLLASLFFFALPAEASAWVDCQMVIFDDAGNQIATSPSIRHSDSDDDPAKHELSAAAVPFVIGQDYIFEYRIRRSGDGNFCSSSIGDGDHYVQLKQSRTGIDRSFSDEIPLSNSGNNFCNDNSASIPGASNEAIVRVRRTFNKDLFVYESEPDVKKIYWKLSIKKQPEADQDLCRFEFDGDDFLNAAEGREEENFRYNICNQIPDNSDNKSDCETCFQDERGIWTALGCIPFDDQGLSIVQALVRVGLSLAGGILLVTILISAFMFTTSQGNPKRTSEAKEMLTSAVIGMVFIIFSVTILEIIGVSILRIPGFGG